MTYTAPEVLLFIGAIGAVLVNVITAWKTSKKVDTIVTKTTIIESQSNSQNTQHIEQARGRDREIEILKSIIAKQDKTSALLAQAVAQNLGSSYEPPQALQEKE